MADKTKAELQKPIQDAIAETILDDAPVIIAFHDREHNIIWANKAYRKATGLSVQDLEGKKCYIAWGLNRVCNDCPVAKVIETGEPHEAELTPQNQEHWPDAQGSWLSKAAPIRDGEGAVVGVIEAAFEITGHKQMESQRNDAFRTLRKSEQKLKELVAKTTRSQEELKASYIELRMSKDDLVRSEKLAYTGRIAASIAHEIRNPLTNVSMSVRQLRKGGRIKPEGLRHSEIIERNVERINFLITELLNCARPAKLNPAPCDIHRVIKDALISNKNKIRAQRIKTVKLFSAKASILKIDKEHMGRVLLNLITNAVDAMPGGGNLTISTEINRDRVLIKVQDSGVGIPEKDVIKIFDPFFSTKSQGVGLGLTTCYGIVVSHGGTIEVKSKWREGTTFIISLPVEHTHRDRAR